MSEAKQPIQAGRMSKGGHNVLDPNAKRPPAPQGSGGSFFIDLPKALLATNREDGSEQIVTSDIQIRLKIGVIAENYGLDWGQVITALNQGHTFATCSFYYELPKRTLPCTAPHHPVPVSDQANSES